MASESGGRNDEDGPASPGNCYEYESSEKCPSSHGGDDAGSVGSSWSHGEKKRAAHSDEVQQELRQWMQSHLQYPYPSRTEKDKLAKETGLQFVQVAYWFTNARRRLLPRMITEENTKRREMGLPPITRQTDQWARPLTEKPPHTQMAHPGKDYTRQDAYIALPTENGAELNGRSAEPALASPVQLGTMNGQVLWQSEAQGLRNALYLPLTPPPLKRRKDEQSTGQPRNRKKCPDAATPEERPIARHPAAVAAHAAAHRHSNGQRHSNDRRSSSSSAGATSHRYDGVQVTQSSVSDSSPTAGLLHMTQPVYYTQPSAVYTPPACVAQAAPSDGYGGGGSVQYLQYAVASQAQSMQAHPAVQGHAVLLHSQMPGAAPAAYAGVNGHHQHHLHQHHHHQQQQQQQQLVQSPTQVRPNGVPGHSYSHLIGLSNGMPGHNYSVFGQVILPSLPPHVQAAVPHAARMQTAVPQAAHAPQAYINQPLLLALARPDGNGQ